VNLDEVVGKIVEGCGSRMVLHLAAETIRQASIAAHRRAYPPILALHERVAHYPASLSVSLSVDNY
jgi:hypothetical protein